MVLCTSSKSVSAGLRSCPVAVEHRTISSPPHIQNKLLSYTIILTNQLNLPAWMKALSHTTKAEICTHTLLKPLLRHGHCKLERFLKRKSLY